GLLSKRVLLENESQENFDKIFDHYVQKFKPRDGVEMDLVERMVTSTHRLQRALALEKGLFDAAVGFDIGPDEFKRAWRELTHNNDLQNMQRYQTFLNRTYRQALENLLQLRNIDAEQTFLPNEPGPNFGHSEPLDPTEPQSAESAPQLTAVHSSTPPSPRPAEPAAPPAVNRRLKMSGAATPAPSDAAQTLGPAAPAIVSAPAREPRPSAAPPHPRKAI